MVHYLGLSGLSLVVEVVRVGQSCRGLEEEVVQQGGNKCAPEHLAKTKND